MAAFNVTYERINDREAMHGGTNHHGYAEREVTLREAIRTAQTWPDAASEYRGSYPSDSEASHARWVTLEYFEFESGDNVSLSIHFPECATPASRARLVAFLTR